MSMLPVVGLAPFLHMPQWPFGEILLQVSDLFKRLSNMGGGILPVDVVVWVIQLLPPTSFEIRPHSFDRI